ncbi:MAG: aldo/keto reductase [Kibdelosporangium sp.]
MKYVRLGSSGLRVSQICLGMMSYGHDPSREWQLGEESAEPIVRAAVEAGVTFFDTADMYAKGTSEELTGQLLRKLFPRRGDYVLATKVYFPTGSGPNDRGLSRKHIMAAIDASLTRLGTDHVDLYQIHRFDADTPVEETMTALNDVVRAGKARYLGASSMYAWQFAKAQQAATTRFISMQSHYNLVYREEEREMIPLCLDQGVAVVPYSPMARGLLAGNRSRTGARLTRRAGSDPLADKQFDEHAATDFEVVDALRAVAAGRDLPPAQVALGWLLGRPAVDAVTVGATKPSHVTDAVAAVDVPISQQEAKRLESSYRPHPVIGHT